MKMKGVWNLVTAPQIIATAIFSLTMLVIMTEKIHRTLAAVTGAILLILTGVLNVESAFSYVDVNTLGVLIGMMLFVTVVKNSGIFEYIAIRTAKLARGRPWAIMAMFMVITALLSAFLDNVTTVLLIGPMTLAITNMLKVNPVPFFLSQILASNIGGTATMIGDPPNIMIASSEAAKAAGIDFMAFIRVLGLPCVFIFAVTIALIVLIFRKQLVTSPETRMRVMQIKTAGLIRCRRLLVKCGISLGFTIILFCLHGRVPGWDLESGSAALAGAALLLLLLWPSDFCFP